MHLLRAAAIGALACLPFACAAQPQAITPSPSPAASPLPTRTVHAGTLPVETGVPIALTDLSGRILFDDFEDLFVMDADGSNVITVAGDPAGPEFDGAWSPDGRWVVYRDSTRGINEDDEIAVVRADGSERRVISNDPANDWGPDWSPDGSTIAFNSDRDGGQLRGFLVAPDGTWPMSRRPSPRRASPSSARRTARCSPRSRRNRTNWRSRTRRRGRSKGSVRSSDRSWPGC